MLGDSDSDGVVNKYDRDPLTRPFEAVNVHGVSLNSDQDACMDDTDPEPLSRNDLPIEDCKNVCPELSWLGLDHSGKANNIWYMPEIAFERNKYDILSFNIPALLYMAEVMQTHPEMKITLTGYAHVQNETDHVHLEENRVKAVIAYLISHGVPEGRLIIGYEHKAFTYAPNIDYEDWYYHHTFVEVEVYQANN